VVPLFVPHRENVRVDIHHQDILIATMKAASDRQSAINIIDLHAFAETAIAYIPSVVAKIFIGQPYCGCPQRPMSRGIDETQ
jgi:hypothetical protein